MPSLLRVALAVRTTTAFTTSPFFTPALASGLRVAIVALKLPCEPLEGEQLELDLPVPAPAAPRPVPSLWVVTGPRSLPGDALEGEQLELELWPEPEALVLAVGEQLELWPCEPPAEQLELEVAA